MNCLRGCVTCWHGFGTESIGTPSSLFLCPKPESPWRDWKTRTLLAIKWLNTWPSSKDGGKSSPLLNSVRTLGFNLKPSSRRSRRAKNGSFDSRNTRKLKQAKHACAPSSRRLKPTSRRPMKALARSEEHTSELQSRGHLVCRLLLEKKKFGNLH